MSYERLVADLKLSAAPRGTFDERAEAREEFHRLELGAAELGVAAAVELVGRDPHGAQLVALGLVEHEQVLRAR